MKREITKKEIDKRFVHHPPTEDKTEKYEKIRKRSGQLANLINKECPDSREKSIALTKLEEVVFWVNAGIARNE